MAQNGGCVVLAVGAWTPNGKCPPEIAGIDLTGIDWLGYSYYANSNTQLDAPQIWVPPPATGPSLILQSGTHHRK
jgi:hypothetical protein